MPAYPAQVIHQSREVETSGVESSAGPYLRDINEPTFRRFLEAVLAAGGSGTSPGIVLGYHGI